MARGTTRGSRSMRSASRLARRTDGSESPAVRRSGSIAGRTPSLPTAAAAAARTVASVSASGACGFTSFQDSQLCQGSAHGGSPHCRYWGIQFCKQQRPGLQLRTIFQLLNQLGRQWTVFDGRRQFEQFIRADMAQTFDPQGQRCRPICRCMPAIDDDAIEQFFEFAGRPRLQESRMAATAAGSCSSFSQLASVVVLLGTFSRCIRRSTANRTFRSRSCRTRSRACLDRQRPFPCHAVRRTGRRAVSPIDPRCRLLIDPRQGVGICGASRRVRARGTLNQHRRPQAGRSASRQSRHRPGRRWPARRSGGCDRCPAIRAA